MTGWSGGDHTQAEKEQKEVVTFLTQDNRYRVFIKYCVYSLKFCDFLNSVSSAAALVFYLPGVCVHTLTPRENRERPELGIF